MSSKLRGNMMWHFRQVAIIFFLLLASASLHARSQKVASPLQSVNNSAEAHLPAESSCSDFLADWGQKPQQLQFLNCQNVATSQGPRIIASYRVKGKEAAKVEAIIKQKFRMAPLQLVEGIWQPVIANDKGQLRPASGEFVADNGTLFEVVMTSEQTTLKNRQDWQKIAQFTVSIVQHSEMRSFE